MDGFKINTEKLEKLSKLSENVRTGGKGTMRRKKKVIVKSSAADDKKLEATFKSLSMSPVPVEEVNMFKDDGTVINFVNPKVNVSLPCNTLSVTGKSEIKQLTEILPKVWQQLGPLKGDLFKKISQNMENQATVEDIDDEDDDVPTLVTDFDQQSKLE